MQLLCACLHLTNNNFRAFISIEEILDQPIFSNAQTRMDFNHPTQRDFRQIYHWAIPEKIQTKGALNIWNFQGYQRNSMWNFQGLSFILYGISRGKVNK